MLCHHKVSVGSYNGSYNVSLFPALTPLKNSSVLLSLGGSMQSYGYVPVSTVDLAYDCIPLSLYLRMSSSLLFFPLIFFLPLLLSQ